MHQTFDVDADGISGCGQEGGQTTQDDCLHFPGIYEEAPYAKGSAEKPEEPPIKRELGLTLLNNMYAASQLNASGASAIRDTTKELLAQLAYNSFQQMVNRGIPRVVVEKGRILAKLTFETLELEEEPQTETTPPSPVSVVSSPRFMFKKTSANLFTVSSADLQKLSKVRMAVTPADQGTDHSTEQRTKAYGEVEIHFKTISD